MSLKLLLRRPPLLLLLLRLPRPDLGLKQGLAAAAAALRPSARRERRPLPFLPSVASSARAAPPAAGGPLLDSTPALGVEREAQEAEARRAAQPCEGPRADAVAVEAQKGAHGVARRGVRTCSGLGLGLRVRVHLALNLFT